jgi:hypothetical protein
VAKFLRVSVGGAHDDGRGRRRNASLERVLQPARSPIAWSEAESHSRTDYRSFDRDRGRCRRKLRTAASQIKPESGMAPDLPSEIGIA